MTMNEQRRFDWGPPVQTGDSLKEWCIYLVIIAVLGVGIWLLLDVNARKKAILLNNNKSKVIVAVDEKVETIVPKEEKKTTKAPQQVQNQSIENSVQAIPAAVESNKSNLFVQIGAFSDEASANEIYNLLKKENIDATLLKPDEQFEIYRLVVGPYSTENEAESKAEQLNEIGFPCFVVEAQ